MAQLNDIKGYWNHSAVWNSDGTIYGYECNLDFNELNIWEGQLILHEDGWFEGIVNDPHSAYTNDRFIFGAYFPDMTIELLKVSPSEVSFPLVYRGKRDAKGYDGPLTVLDLSGEKLYGNSHIITRESIKQDNQELQAKINAWKQSMVNNEFISLYNDIAQKRSEFCAIIKREYIEQKFSGDEKEILTHTKEDPKKLSKLFIPVEDDDDNLPF